MDIVTTFLNGDLDEDVLMEVPRGSNCGKGKDLVCNVSRVLYAMKQAPRQWNAKIDEFLVGQLGFEDCISDPCLNSK